ncbi:hypothetical protein OAS95_04775 [Pelagibacteraceae bacterium]|jgi:hypothetical protein|nr:hypothetical protein [Pelagibacteraceae bacterium]
MPYIKTVLILSFVCGFILHYFYEKKVLREKKQSDLLGSSILMGLISIFPGVIFYFMIYGGIFLWSADLSGPIENYSGALPGRILTNIYNLLFNLFGTYTNKICSIILFLIPPLSLWQYLKEHYNFE